MARGFRHGGAASGGSSNNGVLIDGTTVNVNLVDVGPYSHSIDTTNNCVKITRSGTLNNSGVYIYGIEKKNYTKLYITAKCNLSSHPFRAGLNNNYVEFNVTSEQTKMFDISNLSSDEFDIVFYINSSNDYGFVYKLWME